MPSKAGPRLVFPIDSFDGHGGPQFQIAFGIFRMDIEKTGKFRGADFIAVDEKSA